MGKLLNKVNYANTTKTQLRETLNSKGAGIGVDQTFRSYVDKVSNLVTFLEAFHPVTSTSGEGVCLDTYRLDVVVPEKDENGNTIVKVTIADAKFGECIKSLTCGNACKALGQMLYCNNLEKVIAPFVNTVSAGFCQNSPITEMELGVVSMDDVKVVGKGGPREVKLRLPNLTTVTGMSYNFDKITFNELAVPVLEQINGRFLANTILPAGFVFPALKRIGSCAFEGKANDPNTMTTKDGRVYFPAVESIKESQFSTAPFTNCHFTDVYFGPNLTEVSNAFVTNVNGETFTATIHTTPAVKQFLISKGVTKEILDDYVV